MKLVKFNSLDAMNRLNFTNVFMRVFQLKTSLYSLFLVMCLFLVSCGDKPLKTGYIDINQINKEYKLAVQYNEYIKEIEETATLELISIKKEIQLLEDTIKGFNDNKEKVGQDVLQKFYKLQKQFEFQQNMSRTAIEDSIQIYRERLNAKVNKYVYKYAQKNGYDYVYSPAGTGTFMYADSNLNITKDVVYYLNSR